MNIRSSILFFSSHTCCFSASGAELLGDSKTLRGLTCLCVCKALGEEAGVADAIVDRDACPGASAQDQAGGYLPDFILEVSFPSLVPHFKLRDGLMSFFKLDDGGAGLNSHLLLQSLQGMFHRFLFSHPFNLRMMAPPPS